MLLFQALLTTSRVREAPAKDNPCSNGILPNSVSTPPLKQTDALWQVFFAENEQILKNSSFDFGNGYADINFGQKQPSEYRIKSQNIV